MNESRDDVGSGADDNEGVGPAGKNRGLAPWQKVVGIIGLLMVVLVVIVLLVGGGHTSPVQHGMGLT